MWLGQNKLSFCSMSEKNQKEIYLAMKLIMWHAIIYHRRYQMQLREWGK